MPNASERKEAEQINIKVLMYYKVVNDEFLRKIHWSYVSTTQLGRHLELLSTWGFTPITFNDYLLSTRGELRLPKKPVILTFENGYRNTHRLAFPLLKSFGVNAVVFALGDRTIRYDEWNRQMGFAPEELAFDDELREMHEAGFEIGAHSLTHPDLTKLPEDRAWHEVAGAKNALEAVLLRPITSFSYPFGATNDRVRAIVSKAGYAVACGLDSGQGSFGADMLNIRRIAMTSSTNTISFAVKMLTHHEQTALLGLKGTGTSTPRGLEDASYPAYRVRSNGDHSTRVEHRP